MVAQQSPLIVNDGAEEAYRRLIHTSEAKSLFTQSGNLCASLVRPQIISGRHWRLKRGKRVAQVVKRWYTGRSDISHGRHGCCKLLNMFKTVTQRLPWKLVAQWWLKGGRMVTEWRLSCCIHMYYYTHDFIPWVGFESKFMVLYDRCTDFFPNTHAD